MTEVSSEEQAILEQFQARCVVGRHPLEVVFSISADSDTDAVVRRCTICGAVCVDREFDGRIMAPFAQMLFPKSNRVLRARLAALKM